jgi:hypothetical protein
MTKITNRPPLGHWMRVEPLDRNAWPDYPADAARYGNLAAVAMNFYIQTGNLAELNAAVVYARDAARAGNIALYAATML